MCVMASSSYDIAWLNSRSSRELINLVASLGFGRPFAEEGDGRYAYVCETGTYTRTGKTYAKVSVRGMKGCGAAYDYAVWLWTNGNNTLKEQKSIKS